ncbi:hypothetical protein CCUS01_14567 [Colletotrichum cuscutae]|uniref:Uncharacterized protein n=1 Tax=Colletotrichum cuscutae TaxID=1209917 RepID=A0AAI9Y8R9_9PEZI|nr:hypothetical protein CCUS01_14567 [Colletotrichum cuscutae]
MVVHCHPKSPRLHPASLRSRSALSTRQNHGPLPPRRPFSSLDQPPPTDNLHAGTQAKGSNELAFARFTTVDAQDRLMLPQPALPCCINPYDVAYALLYPYEYLQIIRRSGH